MNDRTCVFSYFFSAGWSYKLRRVRCNDEIGHGLEKSIAAILTRTIQQSQLEIDGRSLLTNEQ